MFTAKAVEVLLAPIWALKLTKETAIGAFQRKTTIFAARLNSKMRTLIYTFSLLVLLLQLASCKTGGISADEKAHVDSLAGLPRMGYARGGTVFSLAEIDGLRAKSKDSVPWASYMAESDSNGQLGYYFFPGYNIELSSPQIRLEYMHRNLKGCANADSLFHWLKGIFLSPERRGKVVGEEPVGTLDGQVVTILEIETPDFSINDSTTYSGKWMAWGYAENGDRLVGFSYTATKADDYKQGIAQFKDLVRSYKDNLE